MKKLIRCKIKVEESQVEILWGVLALYVSFGWEEESLPTGETLITIHNESQEFIDSLVSAVQEYIINAQIELDEIIEQDWTEAWREFFTPISCGKHFMVIPPWLKDSTDFQGRKPIIIEPKSAFGTGHHNTTALCLQVISDLLERECICKGMEFLDIGTGSGILSLACSISGLYGLGVDIEIPSIENAKENLVLNQIPTYSKQEKQGIDLKLGSVELAKEQSFDLVLANILAGPLKDLANDIVPLVAKGGCLVLSGILNIQADDVVKAYMAAGLGQARVVNDGDWVALVWENIT